MPGSSRFKVLEDYRIGYAGGACYLCRSSKRKDEDGVIDTGVEILGEGQLGICFGCATELGLTVDMVPGKSHRQVQDDLSAALARCTELEAALEDRTGLVDALEKSLEVVKA